MDDTSGGANWQYKNENLAADQRSEASGASSLAVDVDSREAENRSAVDAVEWTASEFIEHKKPAWWYLSLTAVIIVIAALAYLSGADYFAVAGVIIVGILFAVIAARPPRELHYRLSGRGLEVAGKLYRLDHFKAFWVDRDGAFASLSFLPLKRFMPVLTVYYDPKDEDKISQIISNTLPFEPHKLDPIDKFLKKIRF